MLPMIYAVISQAHANIKTHYLNHTPVPMKRRSQSSLTPVLTGVQLHLEII